MKDLKLTITPQRSALLAGHKNELDVLVRVQAPIAPGELPPRQSLNLALVIDRSGSMSGKPLMEAKRCADLIVSNLDSEDTISLVTYDNRVMVSVPFRKVGDRSGLLKAIHQITSGGTTALYDGWYQGAGQAALGVEQAGISRVLLLSDGQANAGLTDPDEISRYCSEMSEVGVTTSTYGLGDHFNEDLMVQMARAGRGNSYYGQTAEDLMDPFHEEFELLQALCARKVRLQLSSSEGISFEVLNGYPIDTTGCWCLPDLAYGGEAWAAVRLNIPSFSESKHDKVHPILQASVEYCDLDGRNHSLEGSSLSLPTLPPDSFNSIASDQTVVDRFREIKAAQLQEDARDAARRGEWDLVDRLLKEALDGAGDNQWLQSSIAALQQYASHRETESLSKEAMYQASNMRTRLADIDEGTGNYSIDEESEKAPYLRRKQERGKRFS